MGTCLCKGHKELHLSMAVLQCSEEEGMPSPGQIEPNPTNEGVSDKISGYVIGELATSSLLGLVATIKDHITKPTAMAQGRVAHLIEWKGWGGGGVGGGEPGGTWTRGWTGGPGDVRRGTRAELQDDQLFYSQMTDEIKEARFAAGVAEQFALAEAAMNIWSLDDRDGPSASWEGTQSLSYYLWDRVGSVGLPQHLYDVHADGGRHVGPLSYAPESPPLQQHPPPPPPAPPCYTPATPAAAAPGAAGNPRTRGADATVTSESGGTLHQAECGSLSEDEVFYN